MYFKYSHILNKLPGHLIAVIIIAFDRKEYIKDAFDSAIDQTIKSNDFEVIVVKNFTDEYLDGYIQSEGGKLIYSNDKSIGGKLIEGAQATDAPIVCFLEDDDLFQKNKLEIILKMFRDEKELSYYHHGAIFIDQNGNKLDESKYPRESLNMDKQNWLKFDGDLDKLPRKLFNIYPYFNLSSMAFNRILFIGLRDYLKNRISLVDTFLFFMTLIESKPMIFDARKLSLYRVHGKNDSFFDSEDKSIQRNVKRMESVHSGYEELKNIIQPFQFKYVTGKVNQLLFTSKVILGLHRNENRRYFMGALKFLIKEKGALRYAFSRKDTLIIPILSLLSGRLAQSFYYRIYPERRTLD